MDTFQWRSKTKVIAIIDIFILYINIFLILIAILYLDTANGIELDSQWRAISQMGSGDSFWERVPSFPVWAILLTFAIISLILGTQVFAACKLHCAAEIGKDPKEASRNARLWTVVTSIFLAMFGIGYLSILAFTPLVITIVYRAIGLYIVTSFTQELKRVNMSCPIGRQCHISMFQED